MAVPSEVGAGRDNSAALRLAQLLAGQDCIQPALGLFIKKRTGAWQAGCLQENNESAVEGEGGVSQP